MSFPIRPVRMPSDLADKSNGQLPDSILADVPGGRLHHIAAKAYIAMREAAAKDGITLDPTSPVDTYRTLEIQTATFLKRYDHERRPSTPKQWRGQLWWLKPGFAGSAVPGTSNHGWGLAIDIANTSGSRLDWLLANAGKYGFSWETQSEAWHIRYVLGDDHPATVDPTPPALPPFTRTIRRGMKGDDVRLVQRAVGVPADGLFGAITEAAVRRFQRARWPRLGLADGVVGRVTYAAMTRVVQDSRR